MLTATVRKRIQLALNNQLHLADLWGEFNFFDLENNPV